MNRSHLEHPIRASADIADDEEVVLSKMVAGRDKDLCFTRVALEHHLAQPEALYERAGGLPVSDEVRRVVLDRVRGASKASGPTGSRG